MARFVIDGYGQVELNNVAFRRDGRVEAQCRLDATDFASTYAENGMLLAVDNVTRTIKLPAADGTDLIALNYSAEHIYDERTPGLKNFKLGLKDFLPRLGFLAVGDKFTTNCLETTMSADDMADAIETGLYGTESTSGAIALTTTKPEVGTKAVIMQAVKATTMPDGQFALKFQVLAC